MVSFVELFYCRCSPRRLVAVVGRDQAELAALAREIAAAIRLYYTSTHNLAEGAGAAPLAALIKDKRRYAGKRVALVLTGGNVDMPVMEKILRGETPKA